MRSGFSLLEMLFVLTIAGILASLVYPSYQHYVLRAHRIDGQLALLELAVKLEGYYATEHTYQSATIATGLPTDVLSQATSLSKWYQLAILSASDADYRLQATPILAQGNDRQCQSLVLHHDGQKGIAAGPQGAPQGRIEECWIE